MLKFNVKNQTISREDSFNTVADSKGYLTAEFTFSDEWTTPISAIFGFNGAFYTVLLEDNECAVPWEVIKAPGFSVSVFCGDLVTANIALVEVADSGYIEGQTPAPPTPDVYARILTLCNEAVATANSVREDADNGKFDGEDGKDGAEGIPGRDGADGKDGYTPIKGVDYFDGKDGLNGADGAPGADGKDYILTNEDKVEIADIVAEEIIKPLEAIIDESGVLE